MASAICNSFKQEVLLGTHDLDTDVVKLALYTSSATLSASTTAYTSTNEVSGTGYTAGGAIAASGAVTLDGSTACLDFADVTWTSATITARYGLLYNSSKSNKAIAVIDFGADKTSTNGDFTVVMPAAAAATAIVRIA